MANARGKAIDNTHLSVDQAEVRGFIHRDYIAHCLRWTHVAKYLQAKGRYKETRLFDIGCGIDLPLAKLLYSSRLILKSYIGVDYNPLHKFDTGPFHTGKFPLAVYGNVDFATEQVMLKNDSLYMDAGEDYDIFDLPNTFICFEVLEHVEPEHVWRILEKLRQMIWLYNQKKSVNDPMARAFISTPNFDVNVGAANNHVNEMRADLLGWVFEELGFVISGYYGTFASQRDYKSEIYRLYGNGGANLFKEVANYYDSNYLATIFAPLFPLQARNVLWELTAFDRYNPVGRQFNNPPAVTTRWSSSDKWTFFKEKAR